MDKLLVVVLLCVASVTNAYDITFRARNDAGEMVNVTLPSTPVLPDPLIRSAVVHTTNGPIQGYTDRGVNIWRGVPFAAPPINGLRFRSPQLPTPWTTVKHTVAQAHICPQLRLADHVFFGNEDCLYLDVYAPPYTNGSALRPVMFWLYGGGYVFGDGWEFGFYDGFNLVKKHDYIIVAPNYRLGPLGFMALDELRAEDPDRTTGNYALHDQRAALKWVQANIAKFGGDPNQVTIFGESAGGFSVCYHVSSPGSKGLFSRAIMESGSCDSGDFFRPYSQATAFSKTFARSAGCDYQKEGPHILDCLRKLPTGVVMGHLLGPRPTNPVDGFIPRLYPIMSWGPAIDGTNAALTDTPLNLIKQGRGNNVTFIAGHNKDEGTIFVVAAPFLVPGVTLPFTELGLNKTFQYFFQNDSRPQWVLDNLFQYYPRYKYKTLEGLAAAVLRDYVFTCSTRRGLTAAVNNRQSAYMYHYTYKGDWIDQMILGDYHASELFFVWANEFPPIIHSYSKRDREMVNVFGTYWNNVAWFGNPNGNNSTGTYPLWPKFDTTTKRNIVLDVPPSFEEDLGAEVCSFWDQVKP